MESFMSQPMKHLLQNYHDASEQVEAIGLKEIPKDNIRAIDEYIGLTLISRELVSRAILANDSRILVFLIEELILVLAILNCPIPADHLKSAGMRLRDDLMQHGSL